MKPSGVGDSGSIWRALAGVRSRFIESEAHRQAGMLWAIPPTLICLLSSMPRIRGLFDGGLQAMVASMVATFTFGVLFLGTYVLLDATRVGRLVALPGVFVAGGAVLGHGLGVAGAIGIGVCALLVWLLTLRLVRQADASSLLDPDERS